MVFSAPKFDFRGAETPLPAYQPVVVSLGFPGFVFHCSSAQIEGDRMSMVCFDIIIMKVVVVTPSSTDRLGVRRESCLELFTRKE